MNKNMILGLAGFGVAAMLAACDGTSPRGGAGMAPDDPQIERPVFAVTESNRLIRFDADMPSLVEDVGPLPVNGGEQIVGLDFRPASGALFALTSDARLLQVNPATAAATEVTANILPGMGMLDGDRFDIDFNPAANALRVVSDAGLNLRIGPAALPPNDGGPAIVDGQFGYRQGVSAAAYTFPNPPEMRAEGTALFVIDAQSSRLYTQDANAGILTLVGELGIDASSVSGYGIAEIAGLINEHYGVFTVDGAAGLYGINPATGAASLLTTLPMAGYVDLVVEESEDTPLLARDVFLLREDGDDYAVDFAELTLATNALSIDGTLPVVGLMAGEVLVGLSIRNTSREPDLDVGYVVGTSGAIYSLDADDEDNPTELIATQRAMLSAALQGNAFGVDFNPRVDLLRIVSSSGQNLRVNLQEGRVLADEPRAAGFAFTDGTVRLGAPLPQAAAVAYRSEPLMLEGAVPALDFQYIIDTRDSSLGRVIVPNDGAILRVGPLTGAPTLPANAPGAAAQSLDIAGVDEAFAALVGEGETQSTFYRIDLLTGAATAIGVIGGDMAQEAVRAIAVPIAVD